MKEEDFRHFDQIPPETAQTANPAAGADLAVITVPSDEQWLFMGGYLSIVTDANVANRYLTLDDLADGTNVALHLTPASAQTASQTRKYSIGPHCVPGTLVNDTYMMAIPVRGLYLAPGAVIDINLTNIQAADDISAFTYVFKRIRGG